MCINLTQFNTPGTWRSWQIMRDQKWGKRNLLFRKAIAGFMWLSVVWILIGALVNSPRLWVTPNSFHWGTNDDKWPSATGTSFQQLPASLGLLPKDQNQQLQKGIDAKMQWGCCLGNALRSLRTGKRYCSARPSDGISPMARVKVFPTETFRGLIGLDGAQALK